MSTRSHACLIPDTRSALSFSAKLPSGEPVFIQNCCNYGHPFHLRQGVRVGDLIRQRATTLVRRSHNSPLDFEGDISESIRWIDGRVGGVVKPNAGELDGGHVKDMTLQLKDVADRDGNVTIIMERGPATPMRSDTDRRWSFLQVDRVRSQSECASCCSEESHARRQEDDNEE